MQEHIKINIRKTIINRDDQKKMENTWFFPPYGTWHPYLQSNEVFLWKISTRKFRGKKRATIRTIVNLDIAKTREKFEDFPKKSLKTELDIFNIRTKARKWKQWRLFVDKVAEVAYSNASTFNPRTQIEQLHRDDIM